MAKEDLPIDKIKKLSEILKEQELTEIELEIDNFKIRVRKEVTPVMASASIAPAAQVAASSATAASASNADSGNLHLVKSPMVGTYYASPSPDAQAFVKVGDKVKKGDVLCIIEAMKIMNELPCDFDGEVVEVLASNLQAVSYGQVIMKIKP